MKTFYVGFAATAAGAMGELCSNAMQRGMEQAHSKKREFSDLHLAAFGLGQTGAYDRMFGAKCLIQLHEVQSRQCKERTATSGPVLPLDSSAQTRPPRTRAPSMHVRPPY